MLSWLLSTSTHLRSTYVSQQSYTADVAECLLCALTRHMNKNLKSVALEGVSTSSLLSFPTTSAEIQGTWVSQFCGQPSYLYESHATWHFGINLCLLLLMWPAVEPLLKEVPALSNCTVRINMIKQAIHSELCIWDKLKPFVQRHWMRLS